MAGQDIEGLRYAAIGTKEKYYLKWKEYHTVDTLQATSVLDNATSVLDNATSVLDNATFPPNNVETLHATYLPPTTFPLDNATFPSDNGMSETLHATSLQENNNSLLDKHIIEMLGKERLLEIMHDFVVYDRGQKKLCRPNQYFGVKAAQESIQQKEGGIIWHTQGSGKSLTMVWLTKWIREYNPNARVIIITDRDELDKQIEKVFKGIDEDIVRTKSGTDLIEKLNETTPWLLCSLIHKFGNKAETDYSNYLQELRNSLPKDFSSKGDFYVFVDECHRTQSGELNKAMRQILGEKALLTEVTQG